MVILSCWASKRGLGSVGWVAEESNSFTDTTVVKVAVALPSHPIATTEIVASPKKPSSHSTYPVVALIVPALGGEIYQM